MKILRNYVLKECIIPFSISLGVLTFVFLLGYLPQLANKVINKGVPLQTVSLAFLYNIPVLIGYTLPIAALAAIILTFGRFSSDNEIIAIRASGIGLSKVLKPLAALGIVLSIGLLVLNDKVIPKAYFAQRELLKQTGAENPSAVLEAGTFIDDFKGYILFIYRIERNQLHNIRIYQPQPDGRPTRTIIAQEGEFTQVPGEQKIMLKLINGTSDEPDFHNPNNFYKLNFKQSFMTLDLSQKTTTLEKKPKAMTLKELSNKITEYNTIGIDSTPLIAEYHRKVTWSFAPLLFILLGFPIAVVTHHREKTANLLIAVLFAAPYYLLSICCQALTSKIGLPPSLIMWAPNILGGIIVLILNLRLCAF